MFQVKSSVVIFFVAFTLFFSFASHSPGQSHRSPDRLSHEGNGDLTDLSLEDLMNIKITSVSKKSQRLSEAAAAVFVITQEDIRRSGVTTIPDALRMVPGLQVAKVDGNKWAITARGFNGRFANKLLVLMDGRSVYTPLYSGVFWENIDTVLEDVDRIEVIRGPGASLWGANAVNGVINIITKPAEETQGILAGTLVGTEESGTANLRYGGKIREKTPFRLYVKGFERDAAVDADGDETADDWRYLRGGFRLDHQKGERDFFTFQGDIFNGTNGETVDVPMLTPPYINTYDSDHKEEGSNLLARWTRSLSDLSEISLQTYYDHGKHVMHFGTAEVDIFDVEWQHRFPLGKYHDVTWGLGYRLIRDDYIEKPPLTMITPDSRDFTIVNGFLQDEINLLDKRLHLIFGSKFEYNDYTQTEIQPNARVLWQPNERHSVWASVARAVRTPSRVERDATVLMSLFPPPTMGPLPVGISFDGSDDFNSEELTAYELGYRVQATAELMLDAALYYSDYDNLRKIAAGDPIIGGTPPAYVLVPVISTNDTEGEIYGFELAADWKPVVWSRFQAAYTYMELDVDYEEENILLEQDPNHQFSLRAAFDLPRNLELDLWYRHIAEVSDVIEGYDTADVRFGWKYETFLEISVVGRNLFDSHHPEFEPEGLHAVGTEVQQGVYGKVVWKFY